MDLLSLFDVGVELGDSPQRQLVHEVDIVGTFDEFLAETFDGNGEGGTEQADLVFWVTKANDLLEDRLEFG